MSSAAAPVYSYYQPSVAPPGFNTTSNPRQIAANESEFDVNQGSQLLAQDQALANQYGQQQTATENYLAPLEETNASGQGGYSPGQTSQIELTPQQQQNIATTAGISAGAQTASGVGAAERAYAATGGNPAALATYRARAGQSEAANAGQASTGAQVAAQQAGSAGAQAVGNATLAQENQGLNYLGNLQSEQGGQAQTEQGLSQGAYGTEVGGLSSASNTGVTASQTPTTADKIIGGIAGAAGAAGLADGAPGYLDDGQDAIVAEAGPEAVIEDAPKAVQHGASDPVRSNTTFMDEGYYQPENNPPASSGATFMADGDPAPLPPAQGGGSNASLAQQTPGFGGFTGGGMPSWLQQYLANSGSQQSGSKSPQPGQPGWNKTTPFSQAGAAIGAIAKPYVQSALGTGAPPATIPGGQTYDVPYSPGYSGGDASPDDPGAPMADGHMPRYLADGAGPESEEYRDDPENSSEVSRLLSGELQSLADGRMMAGGRMGSGFHWSNRAPHQPHVPAGGYQPLKYDAKPMLADGDTGYGMPKAPVFNPADVETPMAAQGADNPRLNGAQVGGAKIFTKPTLLHLKKADAVVPLSYRPKAKVRPSAALPALAMKPKRPMYGGGSRI